VTARLGYINGGADSVMTHTWFKTLDWDQLANLHIPPPWRPTLSSADDTGHFDFDEEEAVASLTTDAQLTAAEHDEWALVKVKGKGQG